MPARCPELFVDEDSVCRLGGELGFIGSVQLSEVAQTCLYNFLFPCLPLADLPLG